MNLKGLEQLLISEGIDFKPTPGGLLANLGFLIGRVYIRYDEESKHFHFNDKARWISQACILLVMAYFLVTNQSIYSQLQWYACVGVSVAMVGIFAYKEKRIYSLKEKVFAAQHSQEKK